MTTVFFSNNSITLNFVGLGRDCKAHIIYIAIFVPGRFHVTLVAREKSTANRQQGDNNME